MRVRAQRSLKRVLAGVAVLSLVAVLSACGSSSGSGGGSNNQTRSSGY